MFDITPTAPPHRRTPKPAGAGTQKPRWSKYRPANRVPCDECVALLIHTDGQAPIARGARWRRRHGDSDRVLCYPHAAEAREHDGLTPLKNSDD